MLWPVRSHDARGRLVYCGPAAVSALTGIDADVLVRAIQKRRGNDQPVVGTEVYELHQVCLDFGFEVLPVDSFDKPPTLASWERNRTDDEFENAWILDVGDHWMAVRGWWLADSWFSKFEPIRVREPGPHRRPRVERAYCIVKVNEAARARPARNNGGVSYVPAITSARRRARRPDPRRLRFHGKHEGRRSW
jgi:hypothetical protein